MVTATLMSVLAMASCVGSSSSSPSRARAEGVLAAFTSLNGAMVLSGH